MRRRGGLISGLLVAGAVWDSGGVVAAGGIGPDVIVGELYDTQKFGTVGDITGYALATESCNLGDEDLPWFASSSNHPVIAQNLYRLEDGRLEQIGMSWLKHGFTALAGSTCSNDCQNPFDGNFLGVNCSDPYSAGLNGDQDGSFGTGGLGPRSEVDADTGAFLFPYGSQGQSGNAIYKRLQVHNADIDPSLNAGARYFAEGQYVTPQDSAADNQDNNASYREVLVGSFSQGGWEINLVGQTQREKPAIEAWRDVDPGVDVQAIDIAGEGRLMLASKCSDNGDDTWHYEYALYNMNSHRSVGSFTVPLEPTAQVTGVGFHDVDYHSGEPYDLTDWPATVDGDSMTWATDPFDVDMNANALRWGTLYNFRFDADIGPGTTDATIGLFRPGMPESVTGSICAPLGTGVGPGLGVSGACPGEVTISVSGMTPDRAVVLVRGATAGSFTIPVGPCTGTLLGLGSPRILAVLTADAAGLAAFGANLPAQACGLQVQALDLATCSTTPVRPIAP
jgi:hypothetical protein